MNGLTVKQAAAHATVSVGLIRRWIRDGILPHFRLGAKGKRGCIRIAVEDLDGVLAKFRVETRQSELAQSPTHSSFKHLKLS